MLLKKLKKNGLPEERNLVSALATSHSPVVLSFFSTGPSNALPKNKSNTDFLMSEPLFIIQKKKEKKRNLQIKTNIQNSIFNKND